VVRAWSPAAIDLCPGTLWTIKRYQRIRSKLRANQRMFVAMWEQVQAGPIEAGWAPVDLASERCSAAMAVRASRVLRLLGLAILGNWTPPERLQARLLQGRRLLHNMQLW
jgi:hypothetical protein